MHTAPNYAHHTKTLALYKSDSWLSPIDLALGVVVLFTILVISLDPEQFNSLKTVLYNLVI